MRHHTQHNTISRNEVANYVGGIGPGSYSIKHYVEKRDRAKRRLQKRREAAAHAAGKLEGMHYGYLRGKELGRMEAETERAIAELRGNPVTDDEMRAYVNPDINPDV